MIHAARPSRGRRALPLSTIAACVLSIAFVSSCRRDRRPPDALAVHVDLVSEAARARCDHETKRIAFGQEDSSAHVDEPDPRRRADASGFLSLRRPGSDACAAAVGRSVAVEFFTFDRAARKARLETAAIDGLSPQVVRVRLNDEVVPLAEFTLRDVEQAERHAFDIPSDRLLVGRNRLRFDFEHVIEWRHPVTGFRYPLAAFFVSLAFERRDGSTGAPALADLVVGPMPGAGPRASGPGFQMEEGTRASFALRVPPEEPRLRAAAYVHPGEPAGDAVSFTVRVRSEDGAATEIAGARLEAGAREGLEIDAGLERFAGEVVALEFESPPAGGRPRRIVVADAAVLGRRVAPPVEPRAPRDALIAPVAGKSLILITCDAAAARRFTAYGAERENAPAIDRLARRGFVFERTTSPSSYTLASVGSLFTGLWPDSHGVVEQGSTDGAVRLAPATSTLAERLKRNGYRTLALVTNPNAGATYGYGRGFDTYEALYSPELGLWDEGVAADRLAPHLATRIDEIATSDPFFLYLHVFQPHAPYTPPPEFLDGLVEPTYDGPADGSRASIDRYREHDVADYDEADFLAFRDRYDANLRYADDGVARLLEFLESRGLTEDAVVAIVSDHGEALGEHRSLEHGDTIYAEQVEVPWIVVLPSGDGGEGARVAGPASLIDVCPTLLSLLAVPFDADSFDGVDLTPRMAGAAAADRPIFLRSHGALPRFGVRHGGFSYHVDLFTGGEELYRIDDDPAEAHEISASNPVRTEFLRAAVCRFLCERTSRAVERVALSEEAIRQMQEIGYVSADADGTMQCPLRRRESKQ